MLLIPSRGLNLKFYLWVWSFAAYLIVLAYESLALDMTILPVLEKPLNNFQDFTKNNITLITDLDGMGMQFHLKSQLNEYERKAGYNALDLDTLWSGMTVDTQTEIFIDLVHKKGTHAKIFTGKQRMSVEVYFTLFINENVTFKKNGQIFF